MTQFIKRPTFGRADMVMAMFGAVLLWSWYTADVHSYIDVTAVEIHDTVQGQPIHMNVARSLERDFDGFYLVTVRNADGGDTVCVTGRMDVPYRQNDPIGNPTSLPVPLTLSYWAFGGGCTSVLSDGLPVGSYAVETCHGVYNPRWWMPQLRTCWPSVAVFSILPFE